LPTPCLSSCFACPSAWLALQACGKRSLRSFLFKRPVGIPVIANGGFQARNVIAPALADGKCDAVAIARALLAHPNLIQMFEDGVNEPPNPCSYCSECCARTAVIPLGCYDRNRFKSQDEMAGQIMALSSPLDSSSETRPRFKDY
jgi:2,4-dienoyl-CoA reductase (NADPH2)